MDKIWDRKSF